MKKMWCDLCGKQITNNVYTKVETSVRDCETEAIEYYPYADGKPYPLGPLEVHQECLLEAFADFQGKNKLPEGGTTHGA